MGDILFTIVLIVVIICYTVYKIDCNHVNKPKSNYSTFESYEDAKVLADKLLSYVVRVDKQ
ncbi:hypothetical protein BUY95_03840 [Staphylococcus gallinarum]|uniref:hypothetical protein n=1 Tax=Staphylococcus gallinarum TaxID=1293 RepID=UPI000E6A434D|nr:hypothetical protein [Staphylococcus gallinarum]RIL29803.1 hypothetical protein BUY95_03840 [Staphylococcus gallinarum]